MATVRAPTIAEEPGGLLYRAGAVTEAEERALVAGFDALEFSEVRMRGQTARRTVVHFGYRYDYESRDLVPTDPVPAWMAWLLGRAGDGAGVDPGAWAEVLVTRYPPGAGIGWHRDAPRFGPTVVGVSLLAPCRLRFQRRAPDPRLVHELDLAPRSAYVLAGAARWSWQHSIPAMAALRYSVTFRTLARPDTGAGAP